MKKNSKHQDELLRTVMHRVAKDTDRTSLSDDFADRLVQRIRKEESAKRNQMQHKRIWLSVGIAAAILLLLVMGFWLNGKFNEKPELIVQTDSIKAAPLIEEKKVEEQPQKPVEHKEQADSVNKVKELQRIGRPPKQYMAKVEKQDVQPKKEVQPDTIIFTAPPYHIAAETLSEPEIHVRPLRASAPQQQIDYEHLDYEEMKREIQLRGERLRDIGELAINNEEDF